MRTFITIYVLAIVTAVSILGFRGDKSKRPPLEVFPDMDRQARFMPQAENAFFDDRRDDRPVPENTVARGDERQRPKVFSPDFEDKTVGNPELARGRRENGDYVEEIPIKVNHQLMQLGKEKYEVFCQVCHGASGNGNGVTQNYGVLAGSYHNDRIRDMPDGQLYDVIENGKGLMYGYGDRLTAKESWAIVLYVRALQRSQNASAKDLPDGKKAELGL